MTTLALFTIIFCSGIVTASIVKLEFIQIYLSSSAAIVLCLRYFKEDFFFHCLLLLSAYFLGASFFLNAEISAKNHISEFISSTGGMCTIGGIIIEEPSEKNNRQSFVVKAHWIDMGTGKFNCSGKIMVISKAITGLSFGDGVIVRGIAKQPKTAYRRYLNNRQIYALLNVPSGIYCKKVIGRSNFGLRSLSFSLKKSAEAVIAKYLTPSAAAVLEAMVLGDKNNIPYAVSDAMVKSGTIHILVVSGFNVGIVAFIIFIILKSIRVHRYPRSIITIALLIVYCLLTGASNPVLRATVMGIALICAYFARREPDIYNSLSLAALFILALNPMQLFDIGFQLSFASVISIVFIYPRIKALFEKSYLFSLRYLSLFLDGALVSFSAWLGTMGFIAYYFKIFSPVTVIANIFIVPLASLVTLCGFSLLLSSLFFPPLASLFAASTEFSVSLLLRINALLVKLPGAYFYL